MFSYSVFLVVSLDPFDIFSVKETGDEKELLPCRFKLAYYVLKVSIGCMMTAKEFCTLVIIRLRVRISTTSCRVEIAQFDLVASREAETILPMLKNRLCLSALVVNKQTN